MAVGERPDVTVSPSTREALRAQLVRHEGLMLKPYRDTAGQLTIGVGRNLSANGISEQEAMELLDHDIDTAAAACQTWPPFLELDSVRQRVLVDMCFNMGWWALRQFTRMFKFLEQGDFVNASQELLKSKWAGQVGQRAKTLARMMATGVAFVVCYAHVSAAQALPDRHETIHQLVNGKYAGQLNGDDAQGSRVLDAVCADLNLQDDGNWGRLVKNDRNPPFVPYDILVWKPTREHVDVLTAFDSVWIPHGVIPEAWAWLPCRTPSAPVVRGPDAIVGPPVSAPVADLQAEILATLQAHEAAEAAERAEAAAFREDVRHVWRGRFEFLAKYVAPVVTALLAGRTLP